jgi:hypothetical protein
MHFLNGGFLVSMFLKFFMGKIALSIGGTSFRHQPTGFCDIIAQVKGPSVVE